MKYIRTKDDWLFEVLKSDEEYVYVKAYDYDNDEWYTKNIRLCDVRQADIIEDLCDGFYFDREDLAIADRFYYLSYLGDYFVRATDAYCTVKRERFKEENLDFYGFVKRKSGLLFVAKMDKEGNFKLL